MYFALYRKWRPKLFNDIISQNHIITILKNEVKFKKTTHAYLFTGPKGTGKTSCARIFSKAVNCLNSVDGEPCCGIENGTILDVVEIDGASNNSVNDVKILRDEANFVPAYCKFKIYIIDEVHMLSSSAFNALLKLIEEPPKFVIFILATTEVNKILTTVVSRCQRFDFKRISVNDITNKLEFICEKEKFNVSIEALKKIAIMASGSMRDAVSILDECSIADENINLELVNKIFGFVDEVKILCLFNLIFSGNYEQAFKTVDEFYEAGVDLIGLCSDFINFIREVAICKIDFLNSKNFVFSNQNFNIIKSFSKNLKLSDIIGVLDELVECYDSLKFSLNIKLKFELLILKLCLKFRNDNKFNEINEENFFDDKSGVVLLNSSSESKNVFTNEFINNLNNVDYNSNNENKGNDAEVINAIKHNNETNKTQKNQNLLHKTVLNNNFKKLKIFEDWHVILNLIDLKLQNKMLSAFLKNSKAYVYDDKLYIDFEKPIVSQQVLDKQLEISKIINQHTGQQYRIFVKKTKADTTSATKKSINLSTFLDVAKKHNFNVEEN